MNYEVEVRNLSNYLVLVRKSRNRKNFKQTWKKIRWKKKYIYTYPTTYRHHPEESKNVFSGLQNEKLEYRHRFFYDYYTFLGMACIGIVKQKDIILRISHIILTILPKQATHALRMLPWFDCRRRLTKKMIVSILLLILCPPEWMFWNNPFVYFPGQIVTNIVLTWSWKQFIL